jgi:hypothetical protein
VFITYLIFYLQLMQHFILKCTYNKLMMLAVYNIIKNKILHLAYYIMHELTRKELRKAAYSLVCRALAVGDRNQTFLQLTTYHLQE